MASGRTYDNAALGLALLLFGSLPFASSLLLSVEYFETWPLGSHHALDLELDCVLCIAGAV